MLSTRLSAQVYVANRALKSALFIMEMIELFKLGCPSITHERVEFDALLARAEVRWSRLAERWEKP